MVRLAVWLDRKDLNTKGVMIFRDGPGACLILCAANLVLLAWIY
jgi:hypothetical protein